MKRFTSLEKKEESIKVKKTRGERGSASAVIGSSAHIEEDKHRMEMNRVTPKSTQTGCSAAHSAGFIYSSMKCESTKKNT